MKISRSVLWNLAGITVPLVVGVLVMPRIVRDLGIERFGVLSVIWLMIGYFSVFDLGLGRSLTKMVADRLGSGRRDEIPRLVSTTLVLVCVSGVCVSVLLAASSWWIADSVMHASSAQHSDTTIAIICVAFSLPFVLVATALFGLLEAFQAFALISMVRLPVGVLTFLVPLAVLPFSKMLGVITLALGVVRVVTAAVLLWLCNRILPELRGQTLKFHRELLRPLLTFGGWLTVSNIVGPVMTYFDRFLIVAVAGSAAIAFYTVPYDAITRLLVFPTAVQAVLFPAFVTLRYHDSIRLHSVFAKSSQATLLLMSPALVGTMLLGHEGLRIWMGPLFAENSTRVAEILMTGVLVNAMARIPFSFVQSAGHADWTAITHLVELPFYIAALWWLLKTRGIAGAAYAWTGRVCIDTAIFYALGVKIDRALLRESLKGGMFVIAVCIGGITLDLLIENMWLRGLIVAVCAGGCGSALLWRLKGAVSPA